ncbi:MAG TPA: kelch repeat-containing protein [Candidatus Dormibacteraeota bacterium]|nr:kelch repeat-containing protein [Candidatus Dormibacteraeota bacterium]
MKKIRAVLLILPVLCACQLSFSTVGSWTRETGPPAVLTTNNVIPLADGRVAVFSWTQANGEPSNQTSVYDPASGSWTKGAPAPGPALADVVTPLPDGTVLVEGGRDATGNLLGETWIYDPVRNTWSQAGSVNVPRAFPSYAVLSDGRLLIAGGDVLLAQPEQTPTGVTNFKPTGNAEIYDPRTRNWSQAGQLGAVRDGISLVPVANGAAIAAGGCQGAAGWSPPSATVELYDPDANAWTPTTSMPLPVCGAAGVGLRDGRALVVDQYTFAGVQRYFYNSSDDAFLYDPKTRAWTLSTGLAGGGTATVMLTDGRVLVPEFRQGATKGRIFQELVGGQIFDPATNQWNYVSTTAVELPLVYLYQGALQQVAVALPNGTALVIMETESLTFNPNVAPSATQVLDSTGLTFELAGAALVIVVLMLLAYRRSIRTDPMKLA